MFVESQPWFQQVSYGRQGYLLVYSYEFLHKVHLQEIPSQDFLKRLKESRFGADIQWDGRLFQIFGPTIYKLLSPYLAWFRLVTIRFNTCCFHMGLFNWMKIVCALYCQNWGNGIFLLLSCFSSFCLKVVNNCFRDHYIKNVKPFFIYFLFCL